MTLVKFKNNNGFGRESYVPSIFTDFFNDYFTGDLSPRAFSSTVPAVNIHESDNEFFVDLAVPGMKKEDFNIEVENGILTISAEKKSEKNEEDVKFSRKEFSYSSFKRTFTLPDAVNPDKIAASYENGVLAMTLPKKEESKTKPAKAIKVS
ncbi:MAG: Hsp20/alpha crystallin family protein [Bacteroidetes bacterium]|nr:MAG: Hsp20/alpha crystallin family protein [Bacteroidota bacterium]